MWKRQGGLQQSRTDDYCGLGKPLAAQSPPFQRSLRSGRDLHGCAKGALNLNGSACDAGGANCLAINSDPSIQANIQAERDKLNSDMSSFQFYLVISIGFGFNF